MSIEDVGCCAHKKVECIKVPTASESWTFTDSWECCDCGTKFVPEPLHKYTIAQLQAEVAGLKETNEALEDNCDSKDVALGEIYKLCGRHLDGEPGQFDPQMFVTAVRDAVAGLRIATTTAANIYVPLGEYMVAMARIAQLEEALRNVPIPEPPKESA